MRGVKARTGIGRGEKLSFPAWTVEGEAMGRPMLAKNERVERRMDAQVIVRQVRRVLPLLDRALAQVEAELKEEQRLDEFGEKE